MSKSHPNGRFLRREIHNVKGLPSQAALQTCAGRRSGAPHLPAAALWPETEHPARGNEPRAPWEIVHLYSEQLGFLKQSPLFKQKCSNALAAWPR